MKRFLILAAAALVAMGCAKTQVDDPGQEIAFQVVRYKELTKVDDYKTAFQNVPFGAFAFYKGISASDDAVFMNNQKVAYDATKNRWAPDGTTYYWPKTGTLDFISYSPWTADGIDAPLPVVTETGIYYSTWDVYAHPGVDVMYADKVSGLAANTTTYNYNGVPTLFHHALAKVNFQIKAAFLEKTASTGDKTRWEITVSSIVLKDLLIAGNLDLTLKTDGSWERPDVWNSDGSKNDFALDVTNLQTLSLSAQQLNQNVLVLPQSLTQGQSLELVVTIKTYRDQNDGNGEKLILTETDVPVTAMLSNGTLTKWAINNNITYTLNLAPSPSPDDTDPTEIWFDPALADWQNVTVNTDITL